MLALIDKMVGLFSLDMGIDLGTANTLVCVRGRGIVLNEPSVVAVRRGTNQVLLNGMAVGHAAKEMMCKTPDTIVVVRPLRDGVIADFEITEKMLSYFIRRIHNRAWGVKPRVVISIPSGITAVEKQAVVNSAERAGAREVYLLEEPMAAGIGAGLPITEATGSMIVDIGGGTTEVAVLSLAGMVTSESVRIAGDEMDEAIMAYLRRTYNLMVGQPTAERIKIAIGSAYPQAEEKTMEVRGRDLLAGLPRKAVVSSEEIREALREPVESIVNAIRRTLEKTSPELAADLVERGITMAGGGSLLRGLDQVIAQETDLPVVVAEDPLTCVARGTLAVLERLDLMKQILESSQN